MRRIGVAIAASLAISTLASTGSQAASRPSAIKYGGKIKVAISSTFGGWCFSNNNASDALGGQRTVMETLFEKTIGGDMVGLLAESYSASDDLKTHTITLRKGIKFHDGTDFNAAAVKTNLDYASGGYSVAVAGAEAATATRAAHATKVYTALTGSGPLGGAVGAGLLAAVGIASTATPAVAVGTLSFLSVLGALAKGGGLDKATSGAMNALGLTIDVSTTWAASSYTLSTATAFIGNLTAITATDTHTLVMKTNRAQNDVPGMLYASGRFIIRAVAQISNGASNCTTKPIGTGPFKVLPGYNYSDTNELVVVKNADYWRKDPTTGAKLPYLDQITFTSVKESSQRAAAVRKGTYDAGTFASAGEGKFVRDLRQRKSVVTEYATPYEYYLSLFLNQGKAGSPFTSKNARLAVMTCTDRAGFVKARSEGEAKVATSLVGPSSVMYTTTGHQKYSVAASKAFIEAWKAENPTKNIQIKVAVVADTGSASQASAKFWKDSYAKCGIEYEIITKEATLAIATTFNSSETGGAQNAYDMSFAQLFEGTDVSFNLPFATTNAFPAGATTLGSTWRTNIGSVLGIAHHNDLLVDAAFYAGNAAANKGVAKIKYQEATARLQNEAIISGVFSQSTQIFVNNKSGLGGIGKLQIVKGKTQRLVTNWGFDWTGIYKK
jgi:ABC-type transport system substrate-binding protein